MKSPYMADVSRLANEYRATMVQAKSLRTMNDNLPSRKEAECYKRAVEITEKLANLSVGEAYVYWHERQQEASAKFDEISAYALSLAKQQREKAEQQAEQTAAGEKSGKKPSEKPKSRNDAEVPQEVVDRWFKEPPKFGFEKVAGMEELIDKLRGCVRDVAATGINQYLGMDTVHSFFLYGPPGCGKTFISQAFAHELMKQGYKYMSLSGGDIHNSLVGESEKYVERAFREAQEQAPCILFIDEIDSVCRNRSLPNVPSHAMSTTTAFLTGYNAICQSDKPIIFIGATNYPNLVDNAMLDRVELIKIPLPDLKVRAHTFELQFGSILSREPGFTFEDMAEETDNFNQRDIKRLCEKIKRLIKERVQERYSDDGAVAALKSGDFCLTRELFMEALNSNQPSRKDDVIRSLDAWDDNYEKLLDE